MALASAMSDGSEIVPSDFKCCITKQVMRDPVSTVDGHTYEREAIAAWFSTGKNTSPATGLQLSSQALTPNIALKKAITSYSEEMPHLEAQTLKVKDLQACLAVRERDLKAMEAKHANMVPRLDFERLSLRLQRAEQELTAARAEAAAAAKAAATAAGSSSAVSSSACAATPTASASGATTVNKDEPRLEPVDGAIWDVLAATRASDLMRHRGYVEASRAKVENEKLHLEEHVAACDADIATIQVESVEKEREVADRRKRVSELAAELRGRIEDREAKGYEFMSQAEEVGIDEPEAVLTRVREDPSAPQKGKALQRYAELHTECLTLEEDKRLAQALAMASEEATAELRARAIGIEAKRQAAQERLKELSVDVASNDAEMARVDQSLKDLSIDTAEARDAATWAEHASRGFMKPTVENLPMIMLMHQQVKSHWRQADMQMQQMALIVSCTKGQNPRVLSDAKSRGVTAAILRSAGCSLRELVDAKFTAAELKAAHVDAGMLRAEDFGVDELRAMGYSAVEALSGGYQPRQLANAYLADELKAAGISASQLRTEGFGVDVLSSHGYCLQDLHKAGFLLDDVLRALGVPMPEESAISRITRAFHDIPEARRHGEELYSEEVRFSNAPDPRHRYSFKISVVARVQDGQHNGTVGIGFLPRAGPDPALLAWPVRHRIRLRVFSSEATSVESSTATPAKVTPQGHKSMMLDLSTNEGARAFFAEHAPPAADNALGWGFLNFLTKEEYESGKFLFNGSLVVQCELLPP